MGSKRPATPRTRGTQGVHAALLGLWVAGLLGAHCVAASPADESLADLDTRAEEHNRAGRYDDARPLYERAVAVREGTLGPTHPDLARSLNDLAVLLNVQGRQKEAEVLHLRALAIREAALGPEHATTAQSLNNLAVLYRAQGRLNDALPLHQRALAVRERALGPEHPETAQSLDNLANLYRAQGRHGDALPLSQRALAIREKTLGNEHAETARSLDNLSFIHRDLGQYAVALTLARRGLAVREKALGSDHPQTANSLNNLALILWTTGQYDEALPLHRRALQIRESALGPQHPDTAVSLNNLAVLYRSQGRYRDALPLYQRALEAREKTLGPDHSETAQSLDNLANLHRIYGRYADAVSLYLRGLSIREKSLGPDHPETARSVSNLAGVYWEMAQFDEAATLSRRALQIRDKVYGRRHPDTAESLRNVGATLLSLGQTTEALEFYRLALTAFEQALGPEHPEVARTSAFLAKQEARQERYADAMDTMGRVLQIQEKSLGPKHPDVAESLNFMGQLHMLQGNHEQALALAHQAHAIRESGLGPQHPAVAVGLQFLAMSYEAAALAPGSRAPHQMEQALAMARRATAILRSRAYAMGSAGDRGLAAARGEINRNRSGFVMHVRLLAASGGGALDGDMAALEESFEVAQLARASDTASAVAQMATRFARGDDELAQWVRRRQDVVLRLRYLDGEVARALAGIGAANRGRTADAVQAELRQTELQLADIDRTLAQRFPDYQALTTQEPLPLAEARQLLRPTEALLSYLIGEKESYLWVVRPDRQGLVRLPIGQRELEEAVRTLRRSLDVQQTGGRLLPYPAAVAYALYGKLLAPAAALLTDARHLLIVPDDALHGLPFAVLVDEPPREGEPDRTSWLVRRYAFSTLPSEASLKSLRQFARLQVAPDPFVGFGDPVFKGEPNGTRSLAALYTPRGTADVDQLSRLAPLPESAIEISTIARALGAGKESIFLGAAATETQVKRLDLRRYRTLAFATHGFTAGEIRGSIEPALALTPPATASIEDDGLLTAGEIAQLRLNADWVILSACNTAAPDGSIANEGLSGLARAFFFAGSRSLLVTHWPVDSRAAASLTAGTLRELARRPGLRKDEALRRAMLTLLADKRYRHPIYWAPFVIVGA